MKFIDKIKQLSEEDLIRLLINIQLDSPDGESYCIPTNFPDSNEDDWKNLLDSEFNEDQWKRMNFY